MARQLGAGWSNVAPAIAVVPFVVVPFVSAPFAPPPPPVESIAPGGAQSTSNPNRAAGPLPSQYGSCPVPGAGRVSCAGAGGRSHVVSPPNE